MFALRALKAVTLDRRNLTNRIRARGKPPPNDSDLPDEVIFEVARTTGEVVYANAKKQDSLPIGQSEKYKHVAFVRGTDTGADVKSDIMRGIGKKDANFKKMVDQIKEFLQEHVEIDHVIGHSLGGALAVEGVKEVGREVRVVGLDAALVLVDGADIKTRNINTNSVFDRNLDVFGPTEMHHEWNRFWNANTPSGKVGHRAWEAPYQKRFRGDPNRQQEKRTGFFSGKISYETAHTGTAGQPERVGVF